MESEEENDPTTNASNSSIGTQNLQEPPTTPSYSDWTVQALYGVGTTQPSFFAPTVSSSAVHPYLWRNQHLMPHYGSTLPYHAIYSHGGIYPHPSKPMTQGTVIPTADGERKDVDGKGHSSIKKPKGISSNTVCGKFVDGGKAVTHSANDGASQSVNEESSDASDENSDPIASSSVGRNLENILSNAGANPQENNGVSYSGASVDSFMARGPPVPIAGKPVPVTNLNIGMDIWNTSSAIIPSKGRPNLSGSADAGITSTVVGDGVPHDMWMQNESELKRQRRKQSNRESARRSRLRKQAECDELSDKVDTLSNENQNLKTELQKLMEEHEKLASENATMVEQLIHLYGADAIAAIHHNSISNLQKKNGKTLHDKPSR